MRQPIINSEDPELEYNIYDSCCLKYKGILFTGTVLFDDTNPISYTEYKDGEYDGNNVSYHFNGKLSEQSIYKEGQYISGKECYNNGQLKYDFKERTYWDKDGIKAYQNGCWLYKNGIIKIKYEDTQSTIFNSKGEIAITTEYCKPVNQKKYYHSNLIEYYSEILVDLYPELESHFSNIKFAVFGWISQVYVNDNKLGEELLLNLFSHNSKDIQDFAKHLFSFATKKKNGYKERTYWLEKENDKNSKIVY